MQTTTMTQLTTVITLGLSFLIACSSHNRDSPDAATIAHVSLKVSGMMQRGGIL